MSNDRKAAAGGLAAIIGLGRRVRRRLARPTTTAMTVDGADPPLS